MKKPVIIVIAGPTASGKTSLSIELAKSIEGEIISADSMQIYKEMNIGTAKVTKEEMENIKHYMIDFVSPDNRYSVAEFNEIETDLEYRKELENIVEKEGLEVLYKQALEIDSKAMEKISTNDKKRILRVLEIYHQTGKTKTELEKESRKKETKYEYIVFAIDMPREILYERINKRVDIMINQGLIQEVENLEKKYNKFPTAMQGLGYKEVVEYLRKETTKEEMIEKIKQETRRYAKRQLTWFRKNKEITWLNGLDNTKDNVKIICEKIKEKRNG